MLHGWEENRRNCEAGRWPVLVAQALSPDRAGLVAPAAPVKVSPVTPEPQANPSPVTADKPGAGLLLCPFSWAFPQSIVTF